VTLYHLLKAEGWVDLQFSPEDVRFRQEARAWLHDNVPRERRPHAGEAMRAFDTAWQRRQFEGHVYPLTVIGSRKRERRVGKIV